MCNLRKRQNAVMFLRRNGMNRIRYIDSIKGFAVICVIIGHVANGYMGYRGVSQVYYDIYNAVYAFHMPLFFAVSGFLFGRVYLPDGQIKRDKIKAQIINLIFIYYFYSILLGVLKIIFSQFVNNRITATDLFMIPIKPIELYWYIFALILYSFVFSREIVVRRKSTTLLAATFILGVISAWIPFGLIFDVKRVLFYPFFFCLGNTLNQNEKLLEKKLLTILTFLCAVLLYVFFWSRSVYLKNILFVNQALGVSCTLFFFCVFRQYKILAENCLFIFIGRYGLEIYLLHTFIVTACRTLFYELNISNEAVIILASSTAGIVIPIIIAALSKKLRLYNFLFSPYKRSLHSARH